MVALPPPNGIINLPDQPGDPPSSDDVLSACTYCLDIKAAHMSGAATNEHLSDAIIYKLNVLQARAGAGGGAPAWFMPAMQVALQPLTDHVNEIARLSALACNRQMGNGAHLQFAIVLFPNGSDPTSAPHNLPALISIERVDALTRAQSKRYFTGYYPDIEAANIPGTIANRRPFILRAIGCQQV